MLICFLDSFALVDIGSLTKGVFDTKTLLNGNNLECFVLQISQNALPDVLGGTESSYGNKDDALKPLSDTILTRLQGLGCPKLESIDESQYNKFPGYNKCPSGCKGY